MWKLFENEGDRKTRAVIIAIDWTSKLLIIWVVLLNTVNYIGIIYVSERVTNMVVNSGTITLFFKVVFEAMLFTLSVVRYLIVYTLYGDKPNIDLHVF